MVKAVIFDIDGVLLDSWEANIKFYQLLFEKSGYKVPSRKQVEGIFHLPMMDAIRVLAKESSEDKGRTVWEMGKGEKYDTRLSFSRFPSTHEMSLTH